MFLGGPVGGCQVSTSGRAFSMGYIQSQPVVAGNGTLTLRYIGGDRCHKGKPNEAPRSTRINFYCSPSEVRVQSSAGWVILWLLISFHLFKNWRMTNSCKALILLPLNLACFKLYKLYLIIAVARTGIW